ncbi:OmpA family protein [Sneathiella sp.]|uniref:OmpA family protein n=1 Tax=Sneathiella sp. TaxID=1964365 RepID=UPI0025D83C19|nr:OmpA family protein [Sneathiella sp.]
MKKSRATACPLTLLAPYALALPLVIATIPLALADTGNATRPLVEVNMTVLQTAGSNGRAPTRIIDGNTVITLTPPSLRPKKPDPAPEKIVTPLTKPSLTLPETEVAETPPVPVPPINPSKLPAATEDAKFEDVSTPVVKMDTAPIPTPEIVEEMKSDVAEEAAEKVTESAEAPPTPATTETAEADATAETETAVQSEEEAAKEIQLAAITPDAGPPASKALAEATDEQNNLTRILFAEGEMELPDAAQASLQSIADQVINGERQNVQLLAYGSGSNVSAARRLSLSRALAVRSKLMTLGVDNKKIEVRALGEPEGDGPADRVDLLLITR